MIKYQRINDNEWEIYYNSILAGIFRFYEFPDFRYRDKQLTRFLGYIKIESKFRKLGILRYTVKEFNIKSLMVDDIDDIPLDILKRIYNRLGFKLIEGSERFMIRD